MRKPRTTKLRDKLLPFDAARYLTDEVAVAEYVSAALETGDADLVIAALGDIARVRGMARVAKDSGLRQERLRRAVAAGARPRFDTVLKVVRALGIRLTAVAS